MDMENKATQYPTEADIQKWLAEEIAMRTGVPAEDIDVNDSFLDYGMDSAESVILSGDLGDWLGRQLPATLVWDYPTIAELARHLTDSMTAASNTPDDNVLPAENESIAIIGIGCRFPGADNPAAYWQLLCNAVDAVTEVPADRWNVDALYDPDTNASGKVASRWGGFVKHVDQFDPHFFGISPREATRMDPQQRLVLEVAWEAFEDAGLPLPTLAGSKTGVFIGISANDYSRLQFSDVSLIDGYAGTGNAFSIAANRISYLYDLRGPSIALDTACSSSLVSVHLACQSLLNGESTLAVAGGVNLILSPEISMNFSKAGALSPDGRCKAFDSRADGYVRSEGAGVVVLKPLSQALADGDRVYAVIRGSAVNQDGRTNGLMAPNSQAQAECLAEAYQRAGVSPGQVHYVEAHGTGTKLGDPIETTALGEVLSQDRPQGRKCRIGSAKTNIGHLESAAGVAGLIKVALSLKHGQLPPSLHYLEANPYIPFDQLPLHVQTELTAWPLEEGETPLAGVSSFGFGGTNAHVVLAGVPSSEVPQPEEERAELIVLSAHTERALRELAQSYRDWAASDKSFPSLRDLAYTSLTRRSPQTHRLAVAARTREELLDKLDGFLHGEQRNGLSAGKVSFQKTGKLAFVFPGQGPQWHAMGRQLYEQEPVFREVIDECDRVLSCYTDWSLLEELNQEEADSRVHNTQFTQPMLVAFQLALAELWRSWGVEPDGVVGHSMGEVAAACVSGALSLEDAMFVIYQRGLIMSQMTGQGRLCYVELGVDEVLPYLKGHENRLGIAAVNGPGALVLSGAGDAIQEVAEKLQAQDVFYRFLHVDISSHNPLTEPYAAQLEAALADIRNKQPSLAIYSTVTGQAAAGQHCFGSEYWAANLRDTVWYAKAIDQMLADGYTQFVEISPHPNLTVVTQKALEREGLEGVAVFSLRRQEDERAQMLSALGALFAAGRSINTRALYPEGNVLTLPTYPWQREHCWLDEAECLRRGDGDTPIWQQVVQGATRQSLQGPLDLAMESYAERNETFIRLTSAYIMETLLKLGIYTTAGERHTGKGLVETCGLQPVFDKLLHRWLIRLADEGWLQEENGVFVNSEPLPEPQLHAIWQEAHAACEGLDFTIFLDYLKRSGESLLAVLRGDTNPLEVFFPGGSFETTVHLYQDAAIARYYNGIAAAVAQSLAQALPKGRPLRVLEIGAGTGSTANSVIPMLPRHRSLYTFTDLSDLFLERAKRKFKDFDFVEYKLLNIEEDPALQGFEAQSYDLVVAANVLHATLDLNKTLENVHSLLAPGGLLMMWEVTHHQTWFDITFALIDGWSRHDDDLRGDNPLLATDAWTQALRQHGFDEVAALPQEGTSTAALGQHIILAREASLPLTQTALVNAYGLLRHVQAPASGESQETVSNERHDARLADLLDQASDEERIGLITDYLLKQVGRILGVSSSRLDPEQPLNTTGLDSLMAVELRNQITLQTGVTLPVATLLQGPSILQLVGYIDEQTQVMRETASTAQQWIEPKPEQLYEPFPMNDIQHAYWIGRTGAFELGNVSTQLYLELDGPVLDVTAMNRAWQQLIERHPMLRVIVQPNGEQQVVPEVPAYQIDVFDLRSTAQDVAEQRLLEHREQLSHKIRQPHQWPLFDISVHLLEEDKMRLHFSIDFLIADAASLLILFRDWSVFYEGRADELKPIDLSFRDYIFAERAQEETEVYQTSWRYWQERALTLPPAPELPLAQNAAQLQDQKFVRRTTEVAPDTWNRIKELGARDGLTPSMVLCAAYTEVLAKWSKNPTFTINLTLFNRQPLHDQVNDIVGDFTTLNLLEADMTAAPSFLERAKRLQSRLWTDMEHHHVGGIKVMRELARLQGKGLGASMPVVFTSVLEDFHQHLEWLGEIGYSISQTPQVWIDFQVVEKSGTLFLIWDVVEDLFPNGMIQDMLDAYVSLLEQLSQGEEVWQATQPVVTPAKQLAARQAINSTEAPVSTSLLHLPFVEKAQQQPQHPAVIAGGKTWTYEELSVGSTRLGRHLRELGARPNQLIAVVMEKGYEQVLGVLGILQAGAAYLPLDPHQPKHRLYDLLANTQATIVLTQSWIKDTIEWPSDVQVLAVDQGDWQQGDASPLETVAAPEDLAYVIFTSGSTGTPKGVMIDHRGALNTILDVNQRFDVQPTDRALALSALNFDLSVYDVFGLLSAGGTIVMPEPQASRNPIHWAELIRSERVTIWNTVPALMNILVEHAEEEGLTIEPIRLVLMSGDWIPLQLPQRIQSLIPSAQVISLGGATEASIWSILYPIEKVEPHWTSIPYGKPMVNQQFHVLNEALEPCPVWVPGQLYIGGVGLAKGYWQDEAKTQEKFFVDPRTGERLYETGDLGRYLPDGNIEFLGREDFQVKIQGYRIELGEIETAMEQHPDIEKALVSAIGERQAEKRLVGYFIPSVEAVLKAEELRPYLQEKLPDYMIPTLFMELQELPLSANGKLDRQALPMPELALLQGQQEYVAPRNSTEERMSEVWQELIGVEQVGITHNFFHLGGNSLTAIQAIVRLQKAGIVVSAQEIFEHQTIAELAELVEKRTASTPARKSDSAPSPVVREAIQTPQAVPPVDIEVSGDRYDHDHVLLTGVTGYVGVYLLHELLEQTRATVYCLVRAASAEEARERIVSQSAHYFPDVQADDLMTRVVAVAGDMTQPLLGLSESLYQQLADQLDAIYHAAAEVRHVGDRQHFEKFNVKGTEEIVALARTGKDKALHFLSTVGVRGINPEITTFTEQDFDLGQDFDTPYAHTKWAAEKLVRDEMSAGLRATIHRIGFVAADSRTGSFQKNIGDNALYKYIRSTLHMGIAPYLPTMRLDFTPVDFVARAIVSLTLAPSLENGTYHIVNETPLYHYDLMRIFQACGYPIQLVDWDDFMEIAFNLSSDPAHEAELEGIIGFRDSNRANILQVDSTHTYQALDKLGVACPPPTPEWVYLMLKHGIEVGYIRPSAHWAYTKGIPSLA